MKAGTVRFSTFLQRAGIALREGSLAGSTPVASLAMEMLEMAFVDMQGRNSADRMSALRWLHTTQAEGLSFLFCCSVLGLRAPDTRTAMIALASRERASHLTQREMPDFLQWFFGPKSGQSLPQCALHLESARVAPQPFTDSVIWVEFPCCRERLSMMPILMRIVGVPAWAWKFLILARAKYRPLPNARVMAAETSLPRDLCQQMLFAFHAEEAHRDAPFMASHSFPWTKYDRVFAPVAEEQA